MMFELMLCLVSMLLSDAGSSNRRWTGVDITPLHNIVSVAKCYVAKVAIGDGATTKAGKMKNSFTSTNQPQKVVHFKNNQPLHHNFLSYLSFRGLNFIHIVNKKY